MDDDSSELQNYPCRVVGGTVVDLSLWPSPDEGALTGIIREQYFDRKVAVKLYLKSVPAEQLKHETGIGEKQVYRLINERCLVLHEDGRLYGWRGLIPHIHIRPYKRHTKIRIDNFGKGGAGAMQALLDRYPEIRAEFQRRILKHSDGKKLGAKNQTINMHWVWFQDELRRRGCEVRNEWPFNTDSLAYYSVRRYVEQIELSNPRALAYSSGGPEFVRKQKTGDGSQRPVFKFLGRVEMDAHKLDGRFCVSIPQIDGGTKERIVHRLWVICIIDVVTRVVLGYHFSMGKEISSDDVMRCIKFALSKWERKTITFSDSPYLQEAGFLSSLGDDFVGLCWDETSVDGALAETCQRVKDALRDGVGAVLVTPENSFSVRRGLDDRPFIEAFFRNLAGKGFQKLSNTTGAKPKDRKGHDPEAIALTSRFQYEYAEEILDVMIANYNGKKHGGIHGRIPLLYAKLLYEASPGDFRRANLTAVESLLSVRKLCTVRGGAKVGRATFVECDYAHYTNEILQNRQDLVGKKIWVIHHKEDDARLALASTQDGTSLGVLRASPPWHALPHSLAVRRAIARVIASGKFHIPAGGDGISMFINFVESQPGHKLPVHPAYLAVRRILSQAADPFVGESTLQAAQERAGIVPEPAADMSGGVGSPSTSPGPEALPARRLIASKDAPVTSTLPPRRMAANRSKDEPK